MHATRRAAGQYPRGAVPPAAPWGKCAAARRRLLARDTAGDVFENSLRSSPAAASATAADKAAAAAEDGEHGARSRVLAIERVRLTVGGTEVGHTRQTAELLQPGWGDRFAYGRPISAAARDEIKLELIHDSH